mgnify:CR=1 FL=1
MTSIPATLADRLNDLIRQHNEALEAIRADWVRADEVAASFEAGGMGPETGGYEKMASGEHAAAAAASAAAFDKIVLEMLPLVGEVLGKDLLEVWDQIADLGRDPRLTWPRDLDRALSRIRLRLEARAAELAAAVRGDHSAGHEDRPRVDAERGRGPGSPYAGDAPPDGWRRTLESLRRVFEADRSRHPVLEHFIIVETEPGPRRPWASILLDGPAIQRDGRVQKICCGRIWATCRPPNPDGSGRFRYLGGFLCGSDDAAVANLATGAFQRTAEAAWRCVPEDLRRSLVVEPYLHAAAEREPWAAWVLALYALAWSGPEGGALRADRTVYFARGTVNLEPLLRPWDPPVQVPADAPPEVRAAFASVSVAPRIEDSLEHCPFLTPEERASVRLPLEQFAAFLQPDLYLASALAADLLLGWRAGEPQQDGARPPGPGAGMRRIGPPGKPPEQVAILGPRG